MEKNKLKTLKREHDYYLALYSYRDVDEDYLSKEDLIDITFTGSNTIKVIFENNTFYGYYPELPKTGIDFEHLKNRFLAGISFKDDIILNGNDYELLKNLKLDEIDTMKCFNLDYDGHLYIFKFRLKPIQIKIDTTRDNIEQVVYNPFWGTMAQPKGINTSLNGIDGSSLYLTDDFQSNLGVISSWFDQANSTLYEIKSKKRKEEKKIMANNNNLFGNLRTGQAGNNYAITYFGGIAFKGKTYYNGKIFEADGLTFPFDMLYFVPATEVKKDDIIEKDGIAYHITDVDKTGTITAINLVNGKEETLIPGGPFGMSMYSKLFNPFGQMKGDNAFGNMMLMQAMFNGDGGSNNAIMMAMLMSQGGFQLPSFQMPAMPKAAEDK